MTLNHKSLKQVRFVALSYLLLLATSLSAQNADDQEQQNNNNDRREYAALKIAVASNFAPVLQDLLKTYKVEMNQDLVLISGSTGKLYTQILHGAPFDVFFAADERRPRMLVEQGLAISGTQYTYAQGAIALWSKKWTGEEAKTHLLERRYQRLAIANPKLAPYGVAALEALDALGVEQKGNQKLLEGENIAQTFHFVRFGSADLGIVSLSQMRQYDMQNQAKTSYWVVPQQYYKAIKQDLVVLQHSRHKEAVAHFLDYIKSNKMKEHIRLFGYTRPQIIVNKLPKIND